MSDKGGCTSVLVQGASLLLAIAFVLLFPVTLVAHDVGQVVF